MSNDRLLSWVVTFSNEPSLCCSKKLVSDCQSNFNLPLSSTDHLKSLRALSGYLLKVGGVQLEKWMEIAIDCHARNDTMERDGAKRTEDKMNARLMKIKARLDAARSKTIVQLLEDDKLDENLQMCRRIRDKMNKKFPTFDALCAHLAEFERELQREEKPRIVKLSSRKKTAAKTKSAATLARTVKA